MKKVAVDEGVGDQLPPRSLPQSLTTQRQYREEGTVKEDPENLLDQEEGQIDPEEDQRDRGLPETLHDRRAQPPIAGVGARTASAALSILSVRGM